jgi:hypothetical protein
MLWSAHALGLLCRKQNARAGCELLIASRHVYAPIELLQRMLILRLHLDACDEDRGAVLPGTHACFRATFRH